MTSPPDKEHKGVTVQRFIMLKLCLAKGKSDFQTDVCFTTDGRNGSGKWEWTPPGMLRRVDW